MFCLADSCIFLIILGTRSYYCTNVHSESFVWRTGRHPRAKIGANKELVERQPHTGLKTCKPSANVHRPMKHQSGQDQGRSQCPPICTMKRCLREDRPERARLYDCSVFTDTKYFWTDETLDDKYSGNTGFGHTCRFDPNV